jgi:hypothetical protein
MLGLAVVSAWNVFAPIRAGDRTAEQVMTEADV